MEGAAGIAGLIKVVLALQHQTIPAHLHFRTPSPHIHWDDFPLRVPTAAMPWEPINGRRIGGVSSFGFSGTNAHVVLEEAPAVEVAAAAAARELVGGGALGGGARGVSSAGAGARAGAQGAGRVVAGAAGHGPGRPCLFTLSAKDSKALTELAVRHAAALADSVDADLPSICHTANVGRAQFAERATILARSISELRGGLTALAEGRAATAPNVRTSSVMLRDPPRIAFLFTGQGAQYVNMARELYDTSPVFRAALDECAQLLAPYLQRPLLDVVFASASEDTALHETSYTQPALFAVEYALTQLWASWGITPNVVMGHSVGEVVAACVAGVLELEDALRLIARRGQLMQSLPAGGSMAAISAPEATVSRGIASLASQVSIAAVNGPAQTVISGAAAAVAAASERFTAAGVRCKPLTVSHAFHSPLVEPILDQFEEEVAKAKLSPPRLRLVSNLMGRVARPEEIVTPTYWRRHIREAVRFADGLQALSELRPDVMVEIGPHSTLLSFASAVFGEGGPRRVASLHKDGGDWEQMLNAAASLYLAGVQLNWRVIGAVDSPRLLDLPTYPFQRERHWFKANAPAPAASRGRATGHPLLGTRLRSSTSDSIYESHLGADIPSFVRQHRVLGRVVLPATAYLDMLLACAHDVLRTDVVTLENVTVNEAMLLADDGALRTVQTVCGTPRDGAVPVVVSSVTDDADDGAAWTGHVAASLRAGAAAVPARVGGPNAATTHAAGAGGGAAGVASELDAVRKACGQSASPDEFYADFEARGLDFGTGFRGIRQLWRGSSVSVSSRKRDASQRMM